MATTEPVKQVTYGGTIDKEVVKCYKCGGQGHLAKLCITLDELGLPRPAMKTYSRKRGASTQTEQPAPTRAINTSKVLFDAAAEAVVAHEDANSAMFEEDYVPSMEVVEPYVPEDYMPTFVLDDVDYDEY